MAVERLDVESSSDPAQVVLHRARYDFTLARLRPGQTVLEVGTGAAVFTQELAPRAASYVGLEYDHETCLRARQKCGDSVEILEGDARNLPFSANRFSFVVCLEVLEHLGDYQAGVREIHRCLSAEGLVVVSVPYRRVGGKSEINPYHVYEPGEQELVSLFKGLFEHVEVYYQFFEETMLMTFARVLHLRKLFGLAQIYADLTAGLPRATERLRIAQKPRGMKITLLLVARGKRQGR
jgi:ubiquinone/menaquinone biosynthesis C-methylase UbiE